MKIPRRTTELFAFIFDPRAKLLFLLGALILSVIGNAAFALLFDFVVTTRLARGNARCAQALIIFGGLLVIGLIWVLLRLMAKTIFSDKATRGDEAFSMNRKGIIFTVGRQSSTMEYCLKKQQPEFVGFICSRATESFAAQIVTDWGIAEDMWRRQTVDPWDVKEVRTATESLISWMEGKSVPIRQIALDVTGGSTPMSVGAFLVAEQHRIDSQYVTSDYENNEPKKGTQRAVLISKYDDVSRTATESEPVATQV